MGIYDNVKKACEIKGISINKLEKSLELPRSSVSKFNANTPNAVTLQKIAEFLDTTVEFLVTGELKQSSSLTSKDERDIAKRLESTLKELESEQQGLMFSGEPLDENTRELLKASLENSIRIAKIDAKQKYTPKKYRKTE